MKSDCGERVAVIKEAFAVEETVALAKKKACEILNADESDVCFEVIQSPEKKKFGIFGGKMAQVRAFIKDSVAERAKNYIKELLYYMGMDSLNVEVEHQDKDLCVVKITGKDIKYIVGRHGETLDAIQYLTGFAANNSQDPFCKIRVEAGEYREKRRKSLEAFARRMAYDAIKNGDRIDLEPMRSYERKLIHSAIQSVPDVDSWSEGENDNRHVVIAPKII